MFDTRLHAYEGWDGWDTGFPLATFSSEARLMRWIDRQPDPEIILISVEDETGERVIPAEFERIEGGA